MAETTPLMAQYAAIKAQYQNEILFFRLGDFYEMFNEDAILVSRLLNLTLTHRVDSPMCGIPYHARKVYIARLLRLGKRIAICEQITAPSAKGIVERKVIEVISPGTVCEEEYLESGASNYLASLCFTKDSGVSRTPSVSLSYCDVSTGACYAVSFPVSQLKEDLSKELGRANPREMLIAASLESNEDLSSVLEQFPGMQINWEQDWHFERELSYKRLLAQFNMANLSAFSLSEKSPEVSSLGYLLEYLARTANTANPSEVLPQITNITVLTDSRFVTIDESSRRNLEITANLRDGSREYSLLETLLFTCTAMGARMLRNRLSYPLTDAAAIKQRQDQVTYFVTNTSLLSQCRAALDTILDIERLSAKIGMLKAHPKDIQALKNSLEGWLSVRNTVGNAICTGGPDTGLARTMIDTIGRALLDDPSTSLTDGGIIREGWSQELDHYRQVQTNFSQILEEYLEEEKRNTGIQTLKIKYNKNVGYFMEVSKGKLDAVPDHFIRTRALTNGDRYTSARLKELETELVNASESITSLEKQLFEQLRQSIIPHLSYLLSVASEIAVTDVAQALAQAAIEQHWSCPVVDDSQALEIIKGRHPVVEYHLSAGEFVPNDTGLTENPFALITGPNMAGKSTYLRQNALIVLLAQIGSYVPAQKAHIGITDKIFCRVGASDNLARGESTFLVEMSETARILRSATERSLVLMDEVGRGTSTEDGLSIAWAVSEYLLEKIRAKTFFATHYHELTRLNHNSLQLLCMDVLESEGQTVFLKKIKPGASANSYGIHVARLAGVPDPVIARAQQVLESLHPEENVHGGLDALAAGSPPVFEEPAQNGKAAGPGPNGLFSDEELILDEILSTDVNNMTPLQALELVSRWKKALST